MRVVPADITTDWRERGMSPPGVILSGISHCVRALNSSVITLTISVMISPSTSQHKKNSLPGIDSALIN